MDDPKSPYPLDYANTKSDYRRAEVGWHVFAIICLVVGAPIVAVGIAVTILDLISRQWIEGGAFGSLILGGSLCALGMRLLNVGK